VTLAKADEADRERAIAQAARPVQIAGAAALPLQIEEAAREAA
jgi:hypothetical protein